MTDDKSYRVLTAVGPDRPGLVQSIAAMIHDAGANLEDSRMAILGGEFALILLLTGPPRAIDQVQARTQQVGEELGLAITLRETSAAVPARDYLPYRMKVSGVDRAGIVAKVGKILAGRSINVASLESRVHYAPLSGTPMFSLHAELQLPSEIALAALRQDLHAACDEENLDFVLEAH